MRVCGTSFFIQQCTDKIELLLAPHQTDPWGEVSRSKGHIPSQAAAHRKIRSVCTVRVLQMHNISRLIPRQTVSDGELSIFGENLLATLGFIRAEECVAIWQMNHFFDIGDYHTSTLSEEFWSLLCRVSSSQLSLSSSSSRNVSNRLHKLSLAREFTYDDATPLINAQFEVMVILLAIVMWPLFQGS